MGAGAAVLAVASMGPMGWLGTACRLLAGWLVNDVPARVVLAVAWPEKPPTGRCSGRPRGPPAGYSARAYGGWFTVTVIHGLELLASIVMGGGQPGEEERGSEGKGGDRHDLAQHPGRVEPEGGDLGAEGGHRGDRRPRRPVDRLLEPGVDDHQHPPVHPVVA